MQYERDNDIRFEKVLLPNGSSGTHAGLAAGFVTRGRSPTIIRSYTVLGDQEQAVQQTLKLANDALALVGSSEIAPNQIDVDGNHRGEGYGIPTAEALEAIASLAQAEGILLDPVYSAKAFAGMLHDIAAGDFIEGLTYCSCTQAADQVFMPIAAHSTSKNQTHRESAHHRNVPVMSILSINGLRSDYRRRAGSRRRSHTLVCIQRRLLHAQLFPLRLVAGVGPAIGTQHQSAECR